MPLLTRDQILAAQDLKTEEVKVPEWGGSVRVRSLDGAERDEFEQQMLETRGANTRVNMRNSRARLVAASVVDEQGKTLFTPADVEKLGGKSAKALNRVFEVAQRLSGLTREDVEELAKNS